MTAGYLYKGRPDLARVNAAILAARPARDLPAGLPDTPGTTAARRAALGAAAGLSPCGTPAAYRRHLRRGEDPDQECLSAESARRSARKSAQRARRRAARKETAA